MLEMPKSWLKEEDFKNLNPIACEVLDVHLETVVGRKKPDIVMGFKILGELENTREMSLWGDNLKLVITKWGADETKYVGKKFSIKQEYNATLQQNFKKLVIN
jgi:hypothetical protein